MTPTSCRRAQRALPSVAVPVLAMIGCSLPADAVPGAGAASTAISTDTASQMNIVAHEDDDFLFMNPDIQNQIAPGFDIVTVYVTAGEADGDGRCASVDGSRDEHARDRQRAVRAAYARMANPALTAAQADAAAWTRELIVPDPEVTWPHTVERYTLGASPNIRLIFMNLREAGDSATGFSGPGTIGQMFQDHALVTNTIVPSCGAAGSCVHSPSCNPDVPWQNYTYTDLVTVLTDLINMYQPYVIRLSTRFSGWSQAGVGQGQDEFLSNKA